MRNKSYRNLLLVGALAAGFANSPVAFPKNASQFSKVYAASSQEITEISDDTDTQTDAEETKNSVADDKATAISVLKDSTLVEALTKMYNTQQNAAVTSNTITLAQLQTLTEVDFSKITDVDISKITSLEVTTSDSIGDILKSITVLNLTGTSITSIPDNAFSSHENLTSITLLDETTNLGAACFKSCKKLESINSTVAADTLPTGLIDSATSTTGTNTGSNAFRDCDALKSITIPALKSPTGIQHANGMFADCDNLTTITISNAVSILPSSIFEGAGYTPRIKKDNLNPDEQAKDTAAASHNSATSVTLSFKEDAASYALTTINDSAFKNANITNLDLSKCTALTMIGDCAFQACVKMQKVTFPKECGDLTVGNYCFYGIEGTDMLIDSKKNKKQQAAIRENAVKYCTNLNTVVLPQTCTSLKIGTSAFGCNMFLRNVSTQDITPSKDPVEALTEPAVGFIMPDYIDESKFSSYVFSYDFLLPKATYHLSTLPEGTFNCCSAMTEITFSPNKEGKTLTTIGHAALANTGLEQATIPGTVTKVEQEAFLGCSAKKIIWETPENVTEANLEIENRAFRFCDQLTVMRESTTPEDDTRNMLPLRTLSVDEKAFDSCTSLENFYLTDNVDGTAPKLGDSIFSYCTSLKEVSLPASLTEIPKNFYIYDEKLEKLPTFYSYDSANKKVVLFESDDIAQAEDTRKRNLCSSNITKINEGAFQLCTNLSLKDRYIYESVTEIGKSAFLGDINLGTINLGPNVAKIDEKCFSDSACKYEVKRNKDDDEKFDTQVIESADTEIATEFKNATSLKTIGQSAFYRSNIQSLNLENASPELTVIEQNTFKNCPKLTTIKFNSGLKIINNDALAADPLLDSVYLYSTTTVKKNVFYSGDKINIKGQNPPLVYTPLDKLKLNILPVAVEVPVGESLHFPFYVMENAENFGNLTIGTGESQNNEIYKYINVEACLGGSNIYYYNKQDSDHVVPEGDYYTPVTETASYKIDNSRTVKTFKITGLEKTTDLNESGQIPFTVTMNFGDYFTNQNKEKLSNSSAVQYQIEVTDKTPAYVVPTDAKDLTITNTLAVTKQKGAFTVAGTYTSPATARQIGSSFSQKYVIKDLYDENIPHSEKDIIIETSDASVLAVNKDDPTSTQAEVNTGSYTLYPKKIGTATIKIYPKSMIARKDEVALVLDYKVVTNITGLDISIPEMYASSAEPGTSFSIIKNLRLGTNETFTRDDATNLIDISDLATKTDNTLKFESSNPEIATIDENGLVTIVAATDTATPVKFTASYQVPGNANPATKELTYNVQLGCPYYPVLYSDNIRTTPVEDISVDAATATAKGNVTLRMINTNTEGKTTYYFNYKKTNEASDFVPNNCNLIIETSNPDIVVPNGERIKENNVDTNKWRVKSSTKSNTITTLEAMTKDKNFSLSGKKCGTATVKIYAENCPANTLTLTVNVKSDIRNLNLSIPSEYSQKTKANDTFTILDSVDNYKGDKVTRTDNTLGKLSTITDNKITFTSSNPSVATIDSTGKVKIIKATETPVSVKFTATVKLSTGSTLEKTLDYSVKCPAPAMNEEIKTSNGATVKITGTTANASEAGTACYTAVPGNATTVSVPDTIKVGTRTFKITTIADGAFANNKTLKSVTIGNQVTSIPKEAFNNCTALTSVKIGSSVQTISDSAFKNCTSLTKISIPKNVTTINTRAFCGCKKLKTVTFNSKAKLTSIGESAFENCTSLTKITIPKKVSNIGTKAFYKCKKLKTVTVKTSVLTSVGSKAFKSIYKKAVIKVPSKKLNDYKPMFKNAGASGKKQKIKK